MTVATIGVFFLLLILVYPAVCAVITLFGALKKRTALKTIQGMNTISEIDRTTDRLKESAFIISIVVAFFVVAPFIAFVLIANF